MPVPDIDRTDLFICLGANPAASNGSLMTAPDVQGRLKAIRERGGRVVRGRPAPHRDRQPSRPSTSSSARAPTRCCCWRWSTCCSPKAWCARPRPGRRRRRRCATPRAAFTPEAHRGRHRHRARRGARPRPRAGDAPRGPWSTAGSASAPRSSAGSPRGCCYVLNALTGHLDERAARCSPRPPSTWSTPEPAGPTSGSFDAWRSRGRGLPEFGGELPVAALAEEIETPGRGQIRALVTCRRQPGAVDAERPPPRARARQASTSWCRSTCTSTRPRASPT